MGQHAVVGGSGDGVSGDGDVDVELRRRWRRVCARRHPLRPPGPRGAVAGSRGQFSLRSTGGRLGLDRL